MAWSLSGNMDWLADVEEWDLWQVHLPDKAETHVRPMWGNIIEEIKVYTVIPSDCLWYVGTRGVPYMEEVEND